MFYPLNYDQINLIEGTYTPSAIKNRDNASFDFWVRALFERAQSSIEFELPDFWQGDITDFWYYCMFKFGYLCISDLTKIDRPDAKAIGMCFNPCGLTGRNFYYGPTTAILSNPLLNDSLELTIGKECSIIKLTPSYMGIWDIIEFYADKLSNLDNAINMSIINNKFAYILAGKTKGAVAALKKMMDKINKGNPAVFLDQRVMNDRETKDTPFQFLQRDNLKQSYLTTDQLHDLHTILNDFDAEIGIPSAPNDKKERETEYESKSKIADGLSRLLTWKRCLNSSFTATKQLYPDLDISFTLRWENEFGEIDNDKLQQLSSADV